MLYIILMLSSYPVLVLPVRENYVWDEVAIATQPTAQERDLQGMCPDGPVEWGEAGAPKLVPVLIEVRRRWNIRWSTGAASTHCRSAVGNR